MNPSESFDDAASIREIYVRRQQVSDDHTTMLAVELFDDAINGIIVPCLMELRALARAIDDVEVQERLQTLITDQRSLVQVLRSVGDRLFPTGGLEDPLGLPSKLREHCHRWSHRARVSCIVEVIGSEQPVIIMAQRALVRLVDTALGVVEQGAVQRVVVQFVYPNLPGNGPRIVIRADGDYDVGNEGVRWSLRDIRESIHALGGRATFGIESEDLPFVVAEFPASVLDTPLPSGT